MEDGEIERLIRAARPDEWGIPKTRSDSDVRRERVIHNERSRHARHVRLTRASWLGGLATAAAITAVVLAVALPQPAAVAVTPAPLMFSDQQSPREIVERAQDQLALITGPLTPERRASSVTWSVDVEDGEIQPEITPEYTSLSWKEDLSGDLVVRAARPYRTSQAQTGPEVVLTDEILRDEKIPAGGFGTPLVKAPGEDAVSIEEMLAAVGVPDEPTADELIDALPSVLDQWTLTNTQEATILNKIATLPDVVGLGATTDRLGRPAWGLEVTSASKGSTSVLLLSAETGRIAGMEHRNDKQSGGIPPGSIISYQLWDVTDGKNQ